MLNIKEKKKINEDKNNEPKQITKLAIGKPGGADFSGEEWEQILEVKCLICKKSFEYEKDFFFDTFGIVEIDNAESTELEAMDSSEKKN